MSTFVFSYSPQDANGIVTVTVTRTVNTTNPNQSETLTATLGGTATYGSTGSGDYTLTDAQGLVSGGNPLTLRFNDGTVNQLTFTLDMRADLVTESPETVNFNFTSNRGAVTLTNNTFTITDAIDAGHDDLDALGRSGRRDPEHRRSRPHPRWPQRTRPLDGPPHRLDRLRRQAEDPAGPHQGRRIG